MAGLLIHSQAKIIREVLILLGLGTDPLATTDWPVFAPTEPDRPDNCITVLNTFGQEDGMDNNSGIMAEHYGFQIRIRSITHDDGYKKANSIAFAIDTSSSFVVVSIGPTTYCVEAMTRKGPVLDIGKERKDGRRDLFTINGIVALHQV